MPGRSFSRAFFFASRSKSIPPRVTPPDSQTRAPLRSRLHSLPVQMQIAKPCRNRQCKNRDGPRFAAPDG